MNVHGRLLGVLRNIPGKVIQHHILEGLLGGKDLVMFVVTVPYKVEMDEIFLKRGSCLWSSHRGDSFVTSIEGGTTEVAFDCFCVPLAEAASGSFS